ncbi:hypothetical protein H2200_004947 [Cladophialophora chaetospira]|uniref:Velvet complex subunit laeA n=1 Tax=Cladophialophora chaetospira TaxID=386627 RepID=A0AA39CKM6_9EURO|nr:hypothetical protein H2200_004947 [Cladophialophora chaetospira]
MAGNLPPDRQTTHMLDIMHTMFMVVREPGKRLTNCPTDRLTVKPSGFQQPSRVLDLGCGTGIWMLEMAQKYPHAEFVGVDLHRMGPPNLELNVVYTAPWDYESPWAMGEKSWDLIHLQMALGSVWRWDILYERILKHLVPGTGYFEQVELDYEPRTADATPLQGPLANWWETYVKSQYQACSRPLDYNPATPERLAHMGFRDVEHRQYMIPLNEWPQDDQTPDYQVKRRAAMWWQVAMTPGEDGNGGHGYEAVSMMPLCKISGWNPDHVKRLCREALEQAADPNLHAYNILHVITARAPGPDEP